MASTTFSSFSGAEAIAGFLTPLAIFVVFFLAQVVLPARRVPGYVINPETGAPRNYQLNGILVFAIAVAVWASEITGMQRDWFYRSSIYAVAGGTVLCAIFSVWAVFSRPKGEINNPPLAFWEGRALELPFFNERFDVKMYLYVVGGTMLSLNALSGAAYHGPFLSQDNGSCSSRNSDQVGEPAVCEPVHDGEDDRSQEHEQDRRKGPVSDDKSKGRASGGRVLGPGQDHEKDAETDRVGPLRDCSRSPEPGRVWGRGRWWRRRRESRPIMPRHAGECQQASGRTVHAEYPTDSAASRRSDPNPETGRRLPDPSGRAADFGRLDLVSRVLLQTGRPSSWSSTEYELPSYGQTRRLARVQVDRRFARGHAAAGPSTTGPRLHRLQPVRPISPSSGRPISPTSPRPRTDEPPVTALHPPPGSSTSGVASDGEGSDVTAARIVGSGVRAATDAGVGVEVGTTVGEGVGVAVRAATGVGVGVEVGTAVGEGVGVGVGTTVGEGVGVGVGTTVGEGVGVGVGTTVGEGVGVAVRAATGVGVGVEVGTTVGEGVGVGVGTTTGVDVAA